MSDSQSTFVARAPFAGLAGISAARTGVVVNDRDGLGLVTVLERPGRQAELDQQVRDQFGIEIPRGPRRAAVADTAFIATGPGAWLATCEGAGNSFAPRLREQLGHVASIADQSDGYAVLRISGPRVRGALCKLVPIDLHPRVFSVGTVACTVAAHIGVILWRLENDADGNSVYEMACYRSFADSFWSALSASAAEFGFSRG